MHSKSTKTQMVLYVWVAGSVYIEGRRQGINWYFSQSDLLPYCNTFKMDDISKTRFGCFFHSTNELRKQLSSRAQISEYSQRFYSKSSKNHKYINFNRNRRGFLADCTIPNKFLHISSRNVPFFEQNMFF